jgi:hypothetical protein
MMRVILFISILLGQVLAQAIECGLETELQSTPLSADYALLGITGRQIKEVPQGDCREMPTHVVRRFQGDCQKAYDFFSNQKGDGEYSFNCYQQTTSECQIGFAGEVVTETEALCYFCR